jgi:hypothetical protein
MIATFGLLLVVCEKISINFFSWSLADSYPQPLAAFSNNRSTSGPKRFLLHHGRIACCQERKFTDPKQPSRLPQKQQAADIFQSTLGCVGLLSQIEYQTSLGVPPLDFFKSIVNILKFSRLTLNLCSPCGMQLKGLGKIHAIADNRSLDR